MATAVKPKPPPPNGAVHSLTVGSTVTGHRRGDARFWSVRNQLLAPILVAMLGLGVLGSVQTVEAIGNARDAHRARVVATTATVTVRLTHELEREMAETVALRQRGGHAGEQLVVAQRGRSNQALMRYRQAMVAAARDARATRAEDPTRCSMTSSTHCSLSRTRCPHSCATRIWRPPPVR